MTLDLLERALPGTQEPEGGAVGIDAAKFAADATREAQERQHALGVDWAHYTALAEQAAAANQDGR